VNAPAALGARPLRLIVIGGGFTGAVFAIHAMRAAARPLEIVVVEPSPELGRGIAYGTQGEAHRINVPSDRMGLSKEDPTEATRWLFANGVLPDAASDDGSGQFYVARSAYGAFVADTLRRTIEAAADRVTFVHRRASATSLERSGAGWQVSLDDGGCLESDVVALCFGHAVPAQPCAIAADVATHPKFVPDPWAGRAFDAIEPTDEVLVVGTGLTMADVIVSLQAMGRTGPVTAVSRRALLPRAHGVFRNDLDILQGASPPATALGLSRLLRTRMREASAEFGWHPVADSFRANLPVLWNALPSREKRKVVRRLLPFWEVHRFRIAPQIRAALDANQRAADLTVEQAGLIGLRRCDGRFVATLKRAGGAADERAFDAVVLCTGPEKDLSRNPLVAALLAGGVARLDATGFGLAVDQESHVIDGEGRRWPDLLAFGPMTRGSFGEMTGAPDIAQHIERLAPLLFAAAPANEKALA
jgi:uncharacterized NAD(P)/FAD-binding protein YdhS